MKSNDKFHREEIVGPEYVCNILTPGVHRKFIYS